MSNDVKALSISFRSDDGCVEHNNRDFFTENVDKSRTPNNITYVKRDLRELYHELFDEALAEYNAKQNRPDRQIPDYYEHIRKGKKEKLFQEIIVMFGNSENCGVGSENWETAVKLLDEYMREFEKRNPNLKVFNAVMHLDEATPHLHINFVPMCYGQKQGLSTRVSMKRAIQQMGFTASGKKETEAILWGSSERAKLTEILNNHNIVRQVVGAFHDHKSVEEYKRYAQIIDSKNAHINALKKENPVDLSSTDVGDILNQNDFLRDAVTKKNKEISQLKAMTKSQFVPIEIYNDEKRQYIIEQLQRVNCPFVEEVNSIYIPEYYEQSVRKALAAFKPMNEQTYSERLKFFIDRLIYSARDFEHFIQLLEANKYEVRRRKYIAVKPPYAQRPFRLKSLGADYSENALIKRIEDRNTIPDSFLQDEYAASKIEKPFYATINATVTLVRKFEITPAKWKTQQPYDFMNDLTIGRLLYCLNTLKWRTFFTLDIYSGMRRGEMLGLEWKDIDFETGVVHIQRTSNYTKAKGIYTDTTKTENSVRFIKLPPEVLAILEQFSAEQEKEKQRLGDKWVENDRLFTKWNGMPMNPQTPYGWLKEFCEKHDFPFYGIHSYRHLHASLLIGAGIDPTTVSGILGHSQVSTSLNIYGHMFRENQVKACNAVAEALNFTKRGA